MIVLWGLPGDDPLAMVAARLRERRRDVAFIDQRRVSQTTIRMRVDDAVDGGIELLETTVKFADVSSIYLRPYDSRRLRCVAEAGAGSEIWDHALRVEDILTSWLEVTEALVVNRPSSMATNNSKPYQSVWIRRLGFSIPATLVTTDPVAALEFWEHHGAVIYKSLSSTRSVVSRLTRDHRNRLHDIANCPTQFQAYVPGIDYRVHVVGDEVFATQIVSDRDDYRYRAGGDDLMSLRACDLDIAIAERCRSLSREMGLVVAGIDLRQTPSGEWYCFEVNPSPGFSFYQECTSQPIDVAIAELLMRAAS
jgi:glutathione synthase/RimK-type ligase-like ATP-grasp enzyme